MYVNHFNYSVTSKKNVCWKDMNQPFEDSGWIRGNRAYSHDVTAAILVFQNNDKAAILVFQTNPVGVGLFSYVKKFFCSYEYTLLLCSLRNMRLGTEI